METILDYFNKLYNVHGEPDSTEEITLFLNYVTYTKRTNNMELEITTSDKHFGEPLEEHNLEKDESIFTLALKEEDGHLVEDHETRVLRDTLYEWLEEIDKEATNGDRKATYTLTSGPFKYQVTTLESVEWEEPRPYFRVEGANSELSEYLRNIQGFVHESFDRMKEEILA